MHERFFVYAMDSQDERNPLCNPVEQCETMEAAVANALIRIRGSWKNVGIVQWNAFSGVSRVCSLVGNDISVYDVKNSTGQSKVLREAILNALAV